MIKKVTLKQVWIDQKPTQYGSFKTNIKCIEYGDRWISGFAKEFKNKEGEIIEIDIFENEKGVKDKDGNVYLNWKFPNKEDQTKEEIEKIKFNQLKLDGYVKQIIAILKKHYPQEFGIRPDPMIPFEKETLENPEKARELLKMAEEETANTYMKDVNDRLSILADEDLEKEFERM